MITEKMLEDFKAHCLDEFPNEAVGVLTARKYHRMKNVADDPENQFEIDPEEYVKKTNPKMVLHSHTHAVDSMELRKMRRAGIDPRTPSVADRRSQALSGLPYGVALCDGEGVSPVLTFGADTPPLIGRRYVWGVTDCFTLVRDYFKLERDIEIEDRIVEFGFWRNGDNLIEEEFEDHGFEEIDRRMMEAGDVLLMQVNTEVPSHLGVLMEDGTILHHQFRELSRKAEWSDMGGYVVKVLRYKE